MIARFTVALHAKGFMLIELLVVISIISMLASVVLVALNGARQKADQVHDTYVQEAPHRMLAKK